MTRAHPLGKGGKVTVSLPKEEFDYLTFLATRGRFGSTRDEVASHLLIRELDGMLEAGFPKMRVPEYPEPGPER